MLCGMAAGEGPISSQCALSAVPSFADEGRLPMREGRVDVEGIRSRLRLGRIGP